MYLYGFNPERLIRLFSEVVFKDIEETAPQS